MFGCFPLLLLAVCVTIAPRSSVLFPSCFHTFVLSLQMGLVACCLWLLDIKEGVCNMSYPKW